MATDESLLLPVTDDDPCGPDLRWDRVFMTVGQALDNMVAQAGGDEVVEGEPVAIDSVLFDEIDGGVRDLQSRTKDLRLLAIHAEASWLSLGLSDFANALENFVAVAEAWPDPDAGVHPRADEDDGDLSERVAPLGKLLNRVPVLAATYGWGEGEPTVDVRTETAELLRGVFDSWTARLEPAFGRDLPLRTPAWDAIRKLIGDPPPGAVEEDGEGASAVAAPVPADAWDLIERAAEVMSTQDRHSPALPVLRLLVRWRQLDIVEIAQSMRVAGVGMEQLLDAVQKQLQGQ